MDKLIHVKNVALSSPGLVISAGASPLVKTTAVFPYTVDGNILVSGAAGDLPSLTSASISIAPGNTGCITVSVSPAGYVFTDAPLDQLTSGITGLFPITAMAAVPNGRALVGYIIVKNASASNFIGGTTAFDAASLTVTYLNAIGGFTE